jgi:hypothetical protein
MADAVITGVSVRDIRFPTSLEAHGSDAMVCFRLCCVKFWPN